MNDLNVNLKILILSCCDVQSFFFLIRVNKEFHNINCNGISTDFGTVTESLYKMKCEREYGDQIISCINSSNDRKQLTWKEFYKLTFKYNNIVESKNMKAHLPNQLIDEKRLMELKLLYYLSVQKILTEQNAAVILMKYQTILGSKEQYEENLAAYYSSYPKNYCIYYSYVYGKLEKRNIDGTVSLITSSRKYIPDSMHASRAMVNDNENIEILKWLIDMKMYPNENSILYAASGDVEKIKLVYEKKVPTFPTNFLNRIHDEYKHLYSWLDQ